MKSITEKKIVEKIDLIKDNLIKSYDAERLANIIEGGDREFYKYSYKVAINLKTCDIIIMDNNSYLNPKDERADGIHYFIPPTIPDYDVFLEQEIKEGNYSKNKTLKGYIKDYISNVGHPCIEEDSNLDTYFYLKDELENMYKYREEV